MKLTAKGYNVICEAVGYLAFLFLIGVGVVGTLAYQYIYAFLWGVTCQ